MERPVFFPKKHIDAECPTCGAKTIGYSFFTSVITNVYCDKCGAKAQAKEIEEKRAANFLVAKERSMIPKKYLDMISDGSGVKLIGPQKKLKSVIQASILLDPRESLGYPYFFGSNGTGKTFLSYYLAILISKKHDISIYTLNVPTWAVETRERIPKDKLNELSSKEVLIIDDIGSHTTYPHIIEALYYITDTRLKMNLPTIVTSVFSPFDISPALHKDNFGIKSMCDAISDRLFSLCRATKIEGESIRLNDSKKFYK